MRCSDDRLFAYTYEPEDFRRVVSCCGDQEGVGPGWDDYTLDVGCGQVLLRFDHGSCRVDDHSRTAGGEGGDDSLASSACGFFCYQLGLLFGMEFSTSVYDEAEAKQQPEGNNESPWV